MRSEFESMGTVMLATQLFMRCTSAVRRAHKSRQLFMRCSSSSPTSSAHDAHESRRLRLPIFHCEVLPVLDLWYLLQVSRCSQLVKLHWVCPLLCRVLVSGNTILVLLLAITHTILTECAHFGEESRFRYGLGGVFAPVSSRCAAFPPAGVLYGHRH